MLIAPESQFYSFLETANLSKDKTLLKTKIKMQIRGYSLD